MKRAASLGTFGLVHLLLLVTVAQITLRLAAKALAPAANVSPPLWHAIIAYGALFALYFAHALAIGVLLAQLWRLLRNAERYPAIARGAVVGFGSLLLLLAGWAFVTSPPAPIHAALPIALTIMLLAAVAVHTIWRSPRRRPGFVVIGIVSTLGVAAVVAYYGHLHSETPSFLLESAFALTMLALIGAQLPITRRCDIGAKLGLVTLTVPLFIHYYGPFALRFLEDESALWSEMPEHVIEYGLWGIVAAALVSPYCFAPKPFVRAAIKLPPLALAAFIGIISATILRQHYFVGWKLASWGLNVELGPGAPTHHIALYAMALAGITWTIVSCISAQSPSRRNIAIGLGLIVAGGYEVQWPLQYLVRIIGLFTISEAAALVGDEERAINALRPQAFRQLPIRPEVWQTFVSVVVEAFRASQPLHKPTTVTVRGDEGVSTTHILARRNNVDVQIRIDRLHDSVLSMELSCGADPPRDSDPEWTLHTRPERLLGGTAHPAPPTTTAPVRKTDDHSFDLRFKIRDASNISDELLDDGLRARSTALLDGWMAYWRGNGLVYRVYPGRGAPLDDPLPITRLSFVSGGGPPRVDRIVHLVDLFADIGSRAQLAEVRLADESFIDEPDSQPELEPEPEPGS